jgi:Tfp pilus assembly protein PilN
MQLRAEQRELEATKARTEDAIERLNEQLARQQRDPQLVDQVERLEARAEDRKRLVERAGSVARASSEGFTPYLEGLARQSRDGLWLTGIQVNLIRDRLRLKGATTQGQRVPDYLQRLRQEPVFEGRRFERFGIDRSEESAFLRFEVASRRNAGEEDDQ